MVDKNGIFCTITWCRDDIENLLTDNGIEVTEENVYKVLDGRTVKTLEEGSIAAGWEILGDIVSTLKHDGSFSKPKTNAEDV